MIKRKADKGLVGKLLTGGRNLLIGGLVASQTLMPVAANAFGPGRDFKEKSEVATQSEGIMPNPKENSELAQYLQRKEVMAYFSVIDTDWNLQMSTPSFAQIDLNPQIVRAVVSSLYDCYGPENFLEDSEIINKLEEMVSTSSHLNQIQFQDALNKLNDEDARELLTLNYGVSQDEAAILLKDWREGGLKREHPFIGELGCGMLFPFFSHMHQKDYVQSRQEALNYTPKIDSAMEIGVLDRNATATHPVELYINFSPELDPTGQRDSYIADGGVLREKTLTNMLGILGRKITDAERKQGHMEFSKKEFEDVAPYLPVQTRFKMLNHTLPQGLTDLYTGLPIRNSDEPAKDDAMFDPLWDAARLVDGRIYTEPLESYARGLRPICDPDYVSNNEGKDAMMRVYLPKNVQEKSGLENKN